ncbi:MULTISPECIES: pyridoxal-phosphate dependent enzyme [unclassified Nocardia]|uniref:pyridoxal-phosphate dependent enzyme n=1 Tax=unclassified Nocardia TaxID=2637762 RepID=UPI00278BB061|nr:MULTISPECIES: pyridoxal-phosphate dependent enzyme [unclassified Nocardia]
MASELAAAFQRLIRQVSAALESAASGVSQRLRAESEAGLREPARALPAADTVVAKPIKFPPPPELRAPTSRERWHALADIAEGRLPEPKIFNSPDLDALARSKLHIALENQWPGTKSIKERAARVVTSKLNDLPPGVPVRIASSGNHAIAYAGALGRRRIPVIAVVPENTSAVKISKLEERGATVIRYGSSYDDAYSHAKRLTAEQGVGFWTCRRTTRSPHWAPRSTTCCRCGPPPAPWCYPPVAVRSPRPHRSCGISKRSGADAARYS